ncbi:hypothetical protein B6U55_03215 [Ligilactobacillus salivarius]|uniref:hypothetical protein n=1 Tax=Ligilactobacillus salivarius TaxID=1624 RepID=UPI0009DA5B42|nr:hypothetical protein [Ligilactobacillus salivarius]OQQ93757.1 hypothetical protein B6U55_03215 [Ligilactobacillus salivarius]
MTKKKKPYSDRRWWGGPGELTFLGREKPLTKEEEAEWDKFIEEGMKAYDKKQKENPRPKGWVPWDDSNE